MRKKAQVVVFEQVILFFMGIILFVICFTVFNVYNMHFSNTSFNEQLSEIRLAVASSIIKLSSKDSDSSITLRVPSKIGDEPYRISLSNSGLNITTLVTSKTRRSSLYRLNESLNFSGSVQSFAGRVIVYKKGNEIKLI